jgi:dipeptidyl aminopeptidase/acylaminoacyl peptidase
MQSNLIPVEEFAKGPDIGSMMLSPDGTRVAVIQTVNGRGAIALSDLSGTNRTVRYRDPDRSIQSVNWSGTGRWLYFMQDKGGDEGYHLFALDATNESAPRDLTPIKGAAAELVRSSPTDDTLLVTLNHRNPEYPDVFRVDLATGTLKEVVRNPDRFIEFFADRSGGILAASAIEADGTLAVYRHTTSDNPWTLAYRAPPAERFKVLFADADPDRLLVRTNRGSPVERIASLDLKNGNLKESGRHHCGRFDAEDLIVEQGKVIGGTCNMEAPDLWSEDAKASGAIASARNFVGPEAGLWWESADAGLSKVAFFTNSGTDPGRYLLWEDGKQISKFAESRPWLASATLSPTRAKWFVARDGLPLLTYVTRPKTSQGATPAVVAIHGGPWSRDLGGFESETQLLANRGYTVVQVNFRGSTGLGRRIFDAGVGQFGRAMSDDIDDVVKQLADSGQIDGDRVCLLGGSYGGYAALMGLARGHMRYRCGIDYAGPVDLATLIGAFPPSWKPYLPRSWYRFVGDPSDPKDLVEMTDFSPLHLANDIKAPLLVFQGANDPRVRKDQSDAIVCSLRSRGIEVDYLLASNEGHSFANEETSLAVKLSMERFLAKHLGGATQAKTLPTAEAARTALLDSGANISCPKQEGTGSALEVRAPVAIQPR